MDDSPSIQADFAKIFARRDRDDVLDSFEALLDAPAPSTPERTFELSHALQGQKALELVIAARAAGRRFALAFVDMRMPPGWDGLETIEQLWAVDPDIQIVICSAYSDHSREDLHERLGKRDQCWDNRLLIVKKPFDTIEVAQCAYALTEKWRLGQESRMQVSRLEAAVQARTLELETTNARLAEQLGHQEVAYREQQRLAGELDRRNLAMAFVLDNVDQGLFTVELDGTIASERSAAVTRLLGPMPADGTLHAYVEQFAPALAPWFDVCWAMLREGKLPTEIALAQMPHSFEVDGRRLELAYKVVGATAAEQVVIVVTDVTVQVAREQAERDHREIGALATRLITDRQGFNDFYGETQHLLGVLLEGAHGDPAALRIPLHTLKGGAGMFGLQSIAELCHQIEDAIDEGEAIGALLAGLAARWQHLEDQLQPLTSAGADRLEIDPEDVSELLEALRRTSDGAQLIRMVEAWRNQRVHNKLERLAEQARSLSVRLGKPHLVQIECERIRLPPLGVKFWSSLVHVIRNAVDHGVESYDERAAAGKTDEPTLTLRAARHATGFVIEIEDHGRGIDWAQLAEVARAAGLPAETSDELIEAMFEDGLTTRTSASETSGRGIGLAAVREAVAALGGSIEITSEAGRGTKFSFAFPEVAAVELPAPVPALAARKRDDPASQPIARLA